MNKVYVVEKKTRSGNWIPIPTGSNPVFVESMSTSKREGFAQKGELEYWYPETSFRLSLYLAKSVVKRTR